MPCLLLVYAGLQQLYRVLDEHKARADVVLLAAMKKKARQLQYEVRWVAVSQYYHYYLHRGDDGTHGQGNRNHWGFKAMKVYLCA